jgi:hypothetical protein
MQLELIGPHPFERDEKGQQRVRIGTLFLKDKALYTHLPGVHAMQRMGFINRLNGRNTATGQPALTPEEEQQLCSESVDLFFDPNAIFIRPNPERMDLVFAGDELLQELVSKRQIKFLSVSNPRVHEAIKLRGERWRLSAIPKDREEKNRLISSSKVGIQGLPIYFYNRLTGTRWLTCQEFEGLGRLTDDPLAGHLQEIARHAVHRNLLGRPEVDFFAADLRRFGAKNFTGVDFEKLAAGALREKYTQLNADFRSAVHESFRKDDYTNKAWCERILATLFLEGNETATEQILSGLSPEFFLQVEWLPGGRFEEGEFLFDPVFEEAASRPLDVGLQRLCDPRARGIIFNLIREYGDLLYINLARIPESLSLERPQKTGRRGVYLAELQPRGETEPIRRFMRLQKWGVWEHLDEGKDLLSAIEESEDYTDFWLDRRLGSRQLGMNLPPHVTMRRLIENYQGAQTRYHEQLIRTTYFERSYVPGVATDKLPVEKYQRPGYGVKLAGMLGKAAATSIIVGRSLELGKRPVFDDGDEVVHDGTDGLPEEILVGDHSGAFGEYTLPLETYAAHYARPVNIRDHMVPNPRSFAEAYLAALR